MEITGHCEVGINLRRWGITNDCFGEECDKGNEDFEHLVCFCPGLAENRGQVRRREFFDQLEEDRHYIFDSDSDNNTQLRKI